MLDALVVGAGPAGLAVSEELRARGLEHRVLERGQAPGHAWSGLYDSLKLHTGKHLSYLPGRRFPRSTPLFPPKEAFLAYLRDYADAFALPILPNVRVERAVPEEHGWRVESATEAFRARVLAIATGILSNPWMPEIPGREAFQGSLLHSVGYRTPRPFQGRRVLVVGAGNSAGEIAPELAAAGAHVTVAVRAGANVVPLTVFGVPIQYIGWAALKLPEGPRRALTEAFGRAVRRFRGPQPFPAGAGDPLASVPVIGFHLVDAIREGRIALRPGLARLTDRGARFTDGSVEPFDDVILATGYRPALGPVEGLVRLDDRGFALRVDRVVSADQPNLCFVGHSYDALGGLANIRRDAPLAAEHVAALAR
jgi:cation diffusion facilitator CzcD-associated flavoprotein CzcO